jgi:hypothetical protein
MTTVQHRIHVVPGLRRLGRVLLPNWLAITVGRHIFTWRDLQPSELRHELQHVRQWQRYGAGFAVRYLAASISALLSGSGWYAGNRFEVEARRAEMQE